MTTNKLARYTAVSLALLMMVGGAQAASTDLAPSPGPGPGTTTDIAAAPLVVTSTSSNSSPVQPNVMFVLDDSGSMGWDYLPDWAGGNNNNTPASLFTNNAYNGVAYSSAITYAIPIDYNNNTSTIVVGASTTVNATVTSITVGGSEIMAGPSAGSRNINTVAANIAAQINLCKTAITGNCTTTGYTASATAGTVTITAPLSTTTFTPVVTKGTGTLTFTPSAFTGSTGSATFIDMTGQTATSGGDATATAAAPNWRAVKDDGFGVQSTTSSNLEGVASFYTFVGGEWCDSPHLRNCQATQTTTFSFPSDLRWCNSTALTTCQGTWSTTFSNARYPGQILTGTQASARITVGGSGSTSITGITVSGFQILSAATTASTSTASTAIAIANAINACTASLIGSCTKFGYSATVAGSIVTIQAPISLGNLTATATVTKTGTMTATVTAFAGGATGTAVPGANVLTIIDPITASYTYPGTTAKATSRTDCLGTTCTYAEEMTNYANWWAYYHTRMQMMKSSASLSFASLDKNYRVGYMSINNNTGSDFLNPATFDSVDKANWYSKLFSAKPNNSTPLRIALATAGRMYAGKLNGTTLNGSTVAEPIQYSCQQNYTLLSTDGYWNEAGNPKQIDGTTDIGNADGNDVRPYYDGALITYPQSTSQIQMDQTQVLQSTSQLQSRTQQLQAQTSNLQQRTGPLQWQTNQQQTLSTLQWKTSQQISTATLQWQTKLQKTTATLQWQTNLQKTTYQLAMWTNLQNVTAPLLKSTKTGNTWSAATQVAANATCTNSATVRCTIGATTTSYVTNFPVPSCAVTWNGTTIGVSSTANASGQVVTACHTDGSLFPSAKLSPATPVGANNSTSCDWNAGTYSPGFGPNPYMWCDINTATGATSYVTTYPPTCATYTVSGTGFVTSDANGNITTACTVNAAYSAATTVAANGTCKGGPTGNSYWNGLAFVADAVQCPTTAASTAYVTTPYPPSCTTTYSGLTGTSTATGTSVVTACPINAAFSTASNVPANATCIESSTLHCSTTGASAAAYVTTYPPTCTPTFAAGSLTNVAGSTSTADATGKVTTCPINATFSGAQNIGANGTCDTTMATVQCSGSAPVTSYVPSCTVTVPAAGLLQADASGKIVTACPNTGATFSTWANTASCTPGAATGGGTTNCRYNWGGWANATASCTPSFSSTGTWNIATGTDCQYTPFTGWTNLAATSCAPATQSAAAPYSVLTARNCQTTDTGWIGAASCAATGTPAATYALFNTSGLLRNCQTITTTSVPVASCIPTSAATGPAYMQTTCVTNQITPATGVQTCTAVAPVAGNSYVSTNCTPLTTGPTNVNSCTAQAASALNNWTATTCGAPVVASGGTYNTLADVAEYYYVTDLRTATLGNCTGNGGATLCTTPDPGPTDKLNNVPKSGTDAASWQHMSTFTLGLGASGYMQYTPSYVAETYGDYFDVKNGSAYNAAGGICSWQTGGICNWPTPSSNSQANIDDLWHAGVNGRGAYFSASNPTSLSSSLTTALASVTKRVGASAAATTSNPNVTSGDNFLFSSNFVTVDWVGELIREQLNLSTGQVVVDASGRPVIDWSAQNNLDAMLYTSRNIYVADPGNLFSGAAANQLKLFTWANLNATEQAYFLKPNISSLSQLCVSGVQCLSAADQTLAAGNNLVNFLRGDRTNEGVPTDLTKYYRLRAHVLGDIVNAEAVYLKGSLLHYADANYTAFATYNATRQGMVYAAANDGMLHAFYAADGIVNATTGQVAASGTTVIGGDEGWAYIPSLLQPSLFNLSDKNYASLHRYFVDGTPTQGEICPTAPTTACTASKTGTATNYWRNILVAGLNDGGRGYYALDITNPMVPVLLWEFTDVNMGYTYGNPEIAKLSDGTWAVFLTSGYNNVAPGDGKGHLYVLNAFTGQRITAVNGTGEITTGVGSTTSPSGLARIIAQVSNTDADASVLQIYGGDLEGNLWRFDVNNNVGAAGYDAQLMATLTGPTGLKQPITTKPQVGIIKGSPVVFVGTGRYLGLGDLGTSAQALSTQTIYGIKDPLSTTSTPSTAIYTNIRTNTVTANSTSLCGTTTPPCTVSNFVQQVQTNMVCPANSTTICTQGQQVRSSTRNPVDFAFQSGWYVDLPDTGERANTDPTLQLGTLGFTTNVPSGDKCAVGGYSFSYFLDYRTGGPVSSSYIPVTNLLGQTTYVYIGSTMLGQSMGTRPVMIRLPNGTVVECVRMSDGTTVCGGVPIDKGIAPTRRVSWRELIKE